MPKRSEIISALRSDFSAFHHRAFLELNPGRKLAGKHFTSALCYAVAKFAETPGGRAIINVPPGHGKTLTATICLAAWLLAKDPSIKIMILSNSEDLAEMIARDIRKILRARWYREAFSFTRLAKGHESVRNFGTTANGGVYAASIHGNITGFRADVIIVDDPHHIDDATALDSIEKTNAKFDGVVRSRLNNPKTGRILVVGHRIHADDLSGRLLKEGGWHRVVYPFVAPSDARYPTFGRSWRRKEGELLMPESWDEAEVQKMQQRRTIPDFQTLYQQNPGNALRPIQREHFQFMYSALDPALPIVLSIDPGQQGGEHNSFSVIQAWAPDGERDILVGQWRQQAHYDELRHNLKRFIRRHAPSKILLEMTGQGPALYADLKRQRDKIVPVPQPAVSKGARLAAHIDHICAGGVYLLATEDWEAYIDEFVGFPRGFDDQVDATTQFLDFMETKPVLELPQPRLQAVAAPYCRSVTSGTSAPNLQCIARVSRQRLVVPWK